MLANRALTAILLSSIMLTANAQIAMPGITLPSMPTPAEPQLQAAAAPISPAPAVTPPAQTATPSPTPGVLTLHDAANGVTEPGAAPTRAVSSARSGAASSPPPLPSSIVPPPLPLPGSSSLMPVPRADVILIRISTTGATQKATLSVKGITRAGLTVGDKVLKQVVSSFRDDGICLDTSLHKPKCATFLTFQNQ